MNIYNLYFIWIAMILYCHRQWEYLEEYLEMGICESMENYSKFNISCG